MHATPLPLLLLAAQAHHLFGTVPFLLNLYATQPLPATQPHTTATITYSTAL